MYTFTKLANNTINSRYKELWSLLELSPDLKSFIWNCFKADIKELNLIYYSLLTPEAKYIIVNKKEPTFNEIISKNDPNNRRSFLKTKADSLLKEKEIPLNFWWR